LYDVLIADDFLAFIKQMERFGFWKRQDDFCLKYKCSNGADALDICKKNKVDVVLTDIKMPKMNGIELLKELAENSLTGAVILLSEYSEFEFARQGLRLGAFDYLVKPIEEEQLADLMSRLKDYLEQKENVKDPYGADEYVLCQDIISNADTSLKNADKLAGMVIEVNDDFNKQKEILLNVFENIFNTLSTDNTWLNELFMAPEEVKRGFFSCATGEELSAYFTERIKNIYELFLIHKKASYSTLIKKVCEYTLEHIHEKLSLETAAGECFVNKTYLSHVFKVETGMTYSDYILKTKMQIACNRLLEKDKKVFEISEELGFESPKYFSKKFKDIYGISPADFACGKTP